MWEQGRKQAAGTGEVPRQGVRVKMERGSEGVNQGVSEQSDGYS